MADIKAGGSRYPVMTKKQKYLDKIGNQVQLHNSRIRQVSKNFFNNQYSTGGVTG